MTVEDLLNHIDFYPDKISFYDSRENVQDTIEITVVRYGTGYLSHDSYFEFKDEYGERKVTHWRLMTDDGFNRNIILEVDFK